MSRRVSSRSGCRRASSGTPPGRCPRTERRARTSGSGPTRRRDRVPMMENGHLEQTPEKRLLLFSGRGYPGLAERISDRLDISLGKVDLQSFSGGEVYARYEQSIRGSDVFIVQSLGEPVNRNLMELLVMIDAAKRASAERIVAVIPWFAYSRQDRKTKPREPITARLVSSMIRVAGANRVMTMDLHVGQIEGFFSFPVAERRRSTLRPRTPCSRVRRTSDSRNPR